MLISAGLGLIVGIILALTGAGGGILAVPLLVFGVGLRVASRATIEASWVHLSHAQLFGRQNPGIDNIGARFSLAL